MAFENVPRLIPLWNAKFINTACRANKHYDIDFKDFPDFGGAGLDFDWANDSQGHENICIPLKIETGSPFTHKYPTLPFLPPVKIEGKLVDPCCGELSINQARYKNAIREMDYQSRALTSLPSYGAKIKKLKNDLRKKLKHNDSEGSFRVSRKLMHVVDNLPEKFPEKPPDHNMDYLGGTMAVLNDKYLIHAGPENHVEITKVCEDFEIDGSAKLEPDLDSQVSLNIEGGHVHQIDASQAAGQDFFLVRQAKKLHLYSLDDSNKPNLIFSRGIESSYAKLSSFLPSRYLLCTRDEVTLRDYESKKIKWTEKCSAKDGWLTSDFGSAPCKVVICQPDSLTLHDTRQKECKVLLVDKSPSLFLKEGLRFSWRFKESYHYVATDHHLFICDERYPDLPVLFWRHMFDAPPLCHGSCQLATEASVVTLGTQATQQAGCFLFHTLSQGLLQSLCPPWHAHPISSVTKYFSNYIDRFGMPLTGVAAIPHQMSSGFTIFQQTSLGDVFAQSFHHADKNAPPLQDSSSSAFENNIWLRQEKLCFPSSPPSPNLVQQKLDEAVNNPGKNMKYIDVTSFFEKEVPCDEAQENEELFREIFGMLEMNEVSPRNSEPKKPQIELDPPPDPADYEKDSLERRITSLWRIPLKKLLQSPPRKKPRLDESTQATPLSAPSLDLSLIFKTPA